MYQIPRISFSSYKFKGEQLWERATALAFAAYRPAFIILFILDTFLCAIAAIVTTTFLPHNFGHAIARFWSRLNLALSGVSVSMTGEDKIQPNQPYIVMANHQSHYDVFALMWLIPLQIRWIIKMELRKVPFFGFACEKVGYIFIDRGDNAKARESLKTAGERIRGGASVIFFPEGTRSVDGTLRTFKKGGFVIALEAQVPILPVTVLGGKEILPKGTLRILPGHMKVIVHDPIPVAGYTYETKEQLMERVRRAIGHDLA
ncbi:MAG: 1-acyl-sn-glycerol-3-phosphate acyltransferase [Deltaproteobacteria bacterium]|nr:1-acyl-sn-glycerol-3-phosphate acyltransferase [Deltaproteobacteria bacterium]